MKKRKKKYYSIYYKQNITKNHKRYKWFYIGETAGKNKIRSHKGDKNRKSNLGSDLRNPKIEFKEEILWSGICTHKEIVEKEKEFIREYKSEYPNGYNLNHGGGGVSNHSAKTIAKISKSRIGKNTGKRSAEVCANMIEVQNRPEVRAKRSESLKGNQNAKGKNIGNQHTKDKHWKCSAEVCAKRRGENNARWIPRETRICACDECGETFECKVNSKQRYISGHNSKQRYISGHNSKDR